MNIWEIEMNSLIKTALFGYVFALATPLWAQNIEFRDRVTLSVGQSAVIKGARGDCGKAPEKAQVALPALKTGTLSLGKAGVRNSNSCGGPTPAIEVIFTATSVGRESFDLFGDRVSVRVK